MFGSVVVYAAYKMITDFGNFAHMGPPFVLPLLFSPFLFVLALYVNYENAFPSLDFTIRDATFRRYAKAAVVNGFHVRTSLLKHGLLNIRNKPPCQLTGIDGVVAQVKELDGDCKLVKPLERFAPI